MSVSVECMLSCVVVGGTSLHLKAQCICMCLCENRGLHDSLIRAIKFFFLGAAVQLDGCGASVRVWLAMTRCFDGRELLAATNGGCSCSCQAHMLLQFLLVPRVEGMHDPFIG